MFPPFNFPNVQSEGYNKTSEACWNYNCIAWAVCDKENWWWPLYDMQGNEGYWPSSVQRKITIRSFTDAFKTAGYTICKDGQLEPGYEKIAIYAIGVRPTHAARQLTTGKWTHKIGANIDVTSSLLAFSGPEYGSVVRFMKKKLG